jgi:hypothetical protein
MLQGAIGDNDANRFSILRTFGVPSVITISSPNFIFPTLTTPLLRASELKKVVARSAVQDLHRLLFLMISDSFP